MSRMCKNCAKKDAQRQFEVEFDKWCKDVVEIENGVAKVDWEEWDKIHGKQREHGDHSDKILGFLADLGVLISIDNISNKERWGIGTTVGHLNPNDGTTSYCFAREKDAADFAKACYGKALYPVIIFHFAGVSFIEKQTD